MKVWIHRDPATGEFDICTEWDDAVGPDFVADDIAEELVKSFARTQLAFYQMQDYLGVAWDAVRYPHRKLFKEEK